ncbi:MAG: hypothetical protein AAF411_00280 [Myxococcota bacterium]
MASTEPATIPEDHLRFAVRADGPEERMSHALRGLAFEHIEDDTRVLLLRQVYLSEFELHRFRAAAKTADTMAKLGPLRDVCLHDRARAEQAMSDLPAAIRSARQAARAAPPDRRSFMYWSLATLLQFDGDPDGAVAALEKGLLFSTKDRPLLVAHGALIDIENGGVPEELTRIMTELDRAPSGEGYGQYILGMISYHIGNIPKAIGHLRAFLRRNARLDEAKALTLREELRRARLTLAALDSQ